jgi:hypothetical protein
VSYAKDVLKISLIRGLVTYVALMIGYVTVNQGKRDCIVCLEMRADELMRRLISGELTNYSVVRTSPEPLQVRAPYPPTNTCSLP